MMQHRTFDCVACGTPLYTAKSKFDSGCGWPAFYEGVPGAIKVKSNSSRTSWKKTFDRALNFS